MDSDTHKERFHAIEYNILCSGVLFCAADTDDHIILRFFLFRLFSEAFFS